MQQSLGGTRPTQFVWARFRVGLKPSARTWLVERSELLIQIGDRLFEHRPVRRHTRFLQVGKGTRAREHQGGALRSALRLFRGKCGSLHARSRRGVLLRLDGLAFPATRHVLRIVGSWLVR